MLIQASRRTTIAGAISGLVFGSALLLQPIATSADSVVTLWHTEPNPKTVGVMKEIIADYEKLNPGVKVNQEVGPTGTASRVPVVAQRTGRSPT